MSASLFFCNSALIVKRNSFNLNGAGNLELQSSMLCAWNRIAKFFRTHVLDPFAEIRVISLFHRPLLKGLGNFGSN